MKYFTDGSFLGGTRVINSFASSVDTTGDEENKKYTRLNHINQFKSFLYSQLRMNLLESPINGNSTCVRRKEPRAGMTGTAVAAVHEHRRVKTLKERQPDKTKVTEDVAASKQALPIRMISTKWQVDRPLPHRLNTEECAEILVTNVISSSCNALHSSTKETSSARTSTPIAISALEKISLV